MEAVTYSLRLDQSNSEVYYSVVREFTDEVIQHTSKTLDPIAVDFMKYVKEYGLEDLRKKEEYILELISFGVLWNTYSATALTVRHAPFVLMTKMGEWRKKHQRIKPYIDYWRGILITLFLLPQKLNPNSDKLKMLEQIDHLCKWFDATGEFKEQALRFVRWRAFLGTKQFTELQKIFSTIEEFTRWFENRSNKTLGIYTQNVNPFLELSRKSYKWREDRISSTRTRIEYHLNMVGAEIMNRAFKRRF